VTENRAPRSFTDELPARNVHDRVMLSPTLLQPVVALVAWTFVMWFWMYITRLPAVRQAKIRLDGHVPRGEQMFYAVALVLAAVSPGTIDATLAWTYVALRVVHSIFQATVNKIEVRFVFFALSSMVLLAMTVRAALAVV
jgi:hypothetical protein